MIMGLIVMILMIMIMMMATMLVMIVVQTTAILDTSCLWEIYSGDDGGIDGDCGNEYNHFDPPPCYFYPI